MERQPQDDARESSGGRPNGHQLQDISNTIVQLQKRFFGKGPTKARTSWAGDDALICILGGGFTPVEQTLFEAGRAETVQEMRHAFQLAMEDRLREEIERIVGRRVVAFMSAAHQDPDVACEIFLLEPKPDDHDSPVSAENAESPVMP